MPQGTQALYHAASKTIRCIECPDESSSAGAPLLDFGIAGGSAQREYERRVAQREARVRGMLGRRLGGVVLAITDEPQSTRAWATGARGEREFEAALADLADVVVLNDRRVPGTRGNIDHLVVGPAGLFVVDAKRYKGSLKIPKVAWQSSSHARRNGVPASADRLCRGVVEDEPRGGRIGGVVRSRTIPDERLGGQVQVTGPFDRSVSDARAPELGVVRPQAVKDWAA
jgi:hypothetical protein